jgi:hypothetical protein
MLTGNPNATIPAGQVDVGGSKHGANKSMMSRLGTSICCFSLRSRTAADSGVVADESLSGCLPCKERNVWKNEFKNCLRWIRSVAIALAAYSILAAFCQAVLFPRVGGAEEALMVAALPLAIDAIPLFVLYVQTGGDLKS